MNAAHRVQIIVSDAEGVFRRLTDAAPALTINDIASVWDGASCSLENHPMAFVELELKTPTCGMNPPPGYIAAALARH